MAQKPLILAVETSSRAGSVAIALGGKMLAEAVFLGPARHSADLFPTIRNLLDRFRRKPQEIEHVYISIGPGSFTGLRIATTLAKTMHLANPSRRTKIVAVDTLDVIAANVIGLATKNTVRDLGDEKQITNYEKIAPILDAKRNQFFVAVYQYYPPTSKNASQDPPASKAKPCTGSNPRCFGFAKQTGGGWKKILPDTLMTAAQFIEKFAGQDEALDRIKSDPCFRRGPPRRIPAQVGSGTVWLLGDGLLYHKDKFKAKPPGRIRFLDQKYWSPQASKVHLLGWQKALAGHFADPVTLRPNYLCRPEAEARPLRPQRSAEADPRVGGERV